MVKIFSVTSLKKREINKMYRIIFPLVLLVACGVSAEETPLNTFPTQTCESKRVTPSEKGIVTGINTLLAELDRYFSDAGSVDEKKLGDEYLERTRKAIKAPVDHMHGRCWNNDQLSCSMLLSSLHETSSFLRSLQSSSSVAAISRLVTKTEEQASALNHFCKMQPWKLS